MLAADHSNDESTTSILAMNKQTHTAPVRGEMKLNEPMSRHTSWRAGGVADRYYIPADINDLSCFMSQCRADETCMWVGLGSNLLVRDGGYRGTVIAVNGVLDELHRSGVNRIRSGAGVSCNKFARYTVAAGLTGAEFLAGIPGTVGGALAMNAGAFGCETWDLVHSVEMMNRDGVIRSLARSEFTTGYRSVDLPAGEFFITAEFELYPDSDNTARSRLKDLLARRSASQPTGHFSCGSVFRNPAGDFAGRLIDACGLKGARRGGAVVSDKHANFIINEGGASAGDIEELILFVQGMVREKTGISLELEVRIIGER
jgi:UDP-N-acetylmuramate dehydrogenase